MQTNIIELDPIVEPILYNNKKHRFSKATNKEFSLGEEDQELTSANKQEHLFDHIKQNKQIAS